MKKQKMRESGITLIALCITIIILILIAGVTISSLTGQDSAINQAGASKDDATVSQEMNIVKIAVQETMQSDNKGDISEENLTEHLNQQIGEGDYSLEYRVNNDSYILTFVDSGNEYTIDADGNVIKGIEEISVLALDQDLIIMGRNDTAQLNAIEKTSTEEKTATDVDWSSTDTTIANVNSNGLVTSGETLGTTQITVEKDGLTATCTVLVQEAVNEVVITPAEIEIDLSVDSITTIIAEYFEKDANVGTSFTYSTSDSSVVEIIEEENQGTGKQKLTLEGYKNGTATIQVKSGNGYVATANVKVVTRPTGIKIQAAEQEEGSVSNGTQYIATIEPSTADTDTEITWSALDTSIATVDSNGLVTPKAGGTTMITATTANGKSDSTVYLFYIPESSTSNNPSGGSSSSSGGSSSGSSSGSGTTSTETTNNSSLFWTIVGGVGATVGTAAAVGAGVIAVATGGVGVAIVAAAAVVGTVVGAVVDCITGRADAVKEAATAVTTAVSNTVKKVTTAVSNAVSTVANAVSNAIKNACVAEGTLITLANGEQVPVEELKGDEELLVWNMNTGTYDKAKIINLISHENVGKEEKIIHLYFSDGTEIEIIKDHGFYDVDLNKYVSIKESNYEKYINHWFLKQAEGTLEKVQLIEAKEESKVTRTFEVLTDEHISCFTNGLLSISSLLDPFCNIFDVNKETMSYDKESMKADIEKYGIYTYEDFAGKISEEAFELYHFKYLKIALGKGVITQEELDFFIKYYNDNIEKIDELKK